MIEVRIRPGRLIVRSPGILKTKLEVVAATDIRHRSLGVVPVRIAAVFDGLCITPRPQYRVHMQSAGIPFRTAIRFSDARFIVVVIPFDIA